MKILILGANGMFGSTLYRYLGKIADFEVVGTTRTKAASNLLMAMECGSVRIEANILEPVQLATLISETKPDVIVNCIGVIKQMSDANDTLITLPINAIFPHQLERLCQLGGIRLIHISTDCVFSGSKGNYKENDITDARDLYGLSKFLGEVHGKNSITLRTSIIGHELKTSHSLLNWFLAQKNSVKGFSKAIFSGLPTVELAKVIHEYVLPNPDINGLYHVSVEPVSKYDLLKLIQQVYKKNIDIIADDQIKIDRSLNSDCFRKATGYVPPDWSELVNRMYRFH